MKKRLLAVLADSRASTGFITGLVAYWAYTDPDPLTWVVVGWWACSLFHIGFDWLLDRPERKAERDTKLRVDQATREKIEQLLAEIDRLRRLQGGRVG